MGYGARIKVYHPRCGGVLVELAGEFDVSCLVALRQALLRASESGRPTFVDLAGVTFADSLCVRELVTRSKTDPVLLCRPSWQFRLAVTACGLEEDVEFRVGDDGAYEAVIAEVRGPEGAKRATRRGERHPLLRPTLLPRFARLGRRRPGG